MKKKVLCIIDIAKQLPLSQSAVSLLLNGKSKERRISDVTMQKGLKFIEDAGTK